MRVNYSYICYISQTHHKILYASVINNQGCVFYADHLKCPDNKVYGTNMGPTWVLLAPDGPHVGPMRLAIRVFAKIWNGPSHENYLRLATCILTHLKYTTRRKYPVVRLKQEQTENGILWIFYKWCWWNVRNCSYIEWMFYNWFLLRSLFCNFSSRFLSDIYSMGLVIFFWYLVYFCMLYWHGDIPNHASLLMNV